MMADDPMVGTSTTSKTRAFGGKGGGPKFGQIVACAVSLGGEPSPAIVRRVSWDDNGVYWLDVTQFNDARTLELRHVRWFGNDRDAREWLDTPPPVEDREVQPSGRQLRAAWAI